MKARYRQYIKLLFAAGLAGIVAVNGMAWMHAKSMTHFEESGARTARPEALSFRDKVQTLIIGVRIPKPRNINSPKDHGLNYETHQISLSSNQFLETWFVPNQKREGMVILFHGYASCKSDLLAAAVEFHRTGYELLLVDFHGSGGSTGQDTSIGFSEGRDVAQTVEYAKNQWPGRKVILYGVSMGSAAILRAIAFEGAKADAIIIENPFDRLVNTVRNRFKAMNVPGFPAAELLVFWGGVQRGYNAFEHNPADYARLVKCPALYMHGEQDPRVTIDQARNVFARLDGKKQLVIFPGAGHELLATARPEEWRREVIRFLGEL